MLVSAVALQGDVKWYVTKYNVMYSVDPAASTWMTVMSGNIARVSYFFILLSVYSQSKG